MPTKPEIDWIVGRAERVALESAGPLMVYCPYYEQAISAVACSRYQDEHFGKCEGCQCRHLHASWYDAAKAARQEDQHASH